MTDLDLFLAGLAARESWMDDALCAQVGWESFFPGKGEPSRPAKQICRLCPVVAECLEYAVSRRIRFGVWGGLSETERRPLYPEVPGQPPSIVAGKRRPSAALYDSRARRAQALAARGASTSDIAAELGISRHAAIRALARPLREAA